MHSIVTTRMLLNLREAASRDLSEWAPTSISHRSEGCIPDPELGQQGRPPLSESNAVSYATDNRLELGSGQSLPDASVV